MDPVANLNALAGVWRDAAGSSERVVENFVGGANNGSGPTDDQSGAAGRDVFVDFERSVDQVAEAAKRFFAQMPFGLHDQSGSKTQSASVAVLDGVGTTEISLPSSLSEGESGSQPWTTDLVGHDGQLLSSDSVTLRRAAPVGAQDVGGDLDGGGATSTGVASFIVKVLVPDDTPSGIFHGQILLTGDESFVLPITVRVHGSER